MRLLKVRTRKTTPWTLKQMEKGIKSMKNKKCRDAQGLVNELCFDSMWYEEVTNQLYEAGVNDNKLALLAKINESNDIAIKTPVGLTRRENIKKIICQGDPWGGIECSLMVDGFGK